MKCCIIHYAAFHQGLHCLLNPKQSSEKEIQFHLVFITCDPSIYTVDHPKVIISYQREESISILRVKLYCKQNGRLSDQTNFEVNRQELLMYSILILAFDLIGNQNHTKCSEILKRMYVLV